ncbi:MAG: tetratricopeptide repeat protein [Acidobacteria bacterium]|nr:tetratricopeptide repeat protein [Acidobacteriota bacterium]
MAKNSVVWLALVLSTLLAGGAEVDWKTAATESHRLIEIGRYTEAEDQFRAQLAEARQSPSPNRLASALNGLALSLRRQGRFQEAHPLLTEAVAIGEQTHSMPRADLAHLLSNLGANLYERALYDDAENLLRRALAMETKANRPLTLNSLAMVAFSRHRFSEADQLFREALKDLIEVEGVKTENTANVQENLGRLLESLNRLDEAESLYSRAFRTRESLLGPAHPDVARGLLNLAGIRIKFGDSAKAETMARRALLAFETARARWLAANAHVVIANALRLQRRLSEAEGHYHRALAILEPEYGPNHHKTAAVLFNLGGLRVSQKRYADAESLIHRALEIREAAYGPGDPTVIATMRDYARILSKLGRKGDAQNIEARINFGGHLKTGQLK